jgi:hypothetical protein
MSIHANQISGLYLNGRSLYPALPGLGCRQQPLRVRITAGWFSILLISALSVYSPIPGKRSPVGFRAADEWSEKLMACRDDLATLLYYWPPNLLT